MKILLFFNYLGISPVTAKDMRNLQLAEAGGNGLLKSRGYTPKTASPLTGGKMIKRKRLDEKENGGSPLLGKSGGLLRGTDGPTPKRQMTFARRTLR